MNNQKLVAIVNRIKLKTFKMNEIYQIPNLVDNINDVTIDFEPLLIYSLYHMASKLKLFHALLQCGCDMFALNDDGISAYYLTHIDESNDIPMETREVFQLYYPGLWAAVDQGNIELVRKTINLWCRIDIKRNHLPLMALAEQRKNSQVISLLTSISRSIALAHGVLSDDMEAVEEVVKNSCLGSDIQNGGINVNIQNLGALGATPLYFAMQNNNEPMVKYLLDLGANPCRVLTLEDEIEIPIIFLGLKATVSFEVYKLVIEKAAEKWDLSSFRYKSFTLLHCAVQNAVELDKIDCLLQNCDAKLISSRSNSNVTSRDIADDDILKDRIDKKVLDNVHDEHFTMDLAAFGYTNFIEMVQSGALNTLANLDVLTKFAHHIKMFTKHLCDSNVIGIQKYLVFNYRSLNDVPMKRYLVECFQIGDSQPMLHKAVLRGACQIVKLLCSVIVGTLGKKVDDIKDQFGRTALCYAFLLKDRTISEALVYFGASEYIIDFENRSPLVFKDKIPHPNRDKFIAYHLNQMYSEPEPPLWAVNNNNRSYIMPYTPIKPHPGDCQECSKDKDVSGSNEEEVDDDDDDDDDEPTSVCAVS